MKFLPFTFSLLLALPAARADEALEFFEKEIRPVLVTHCYECHSGDEAKAGLRLDYRGGWEQGGESGPPIVPGDADRHIFLKRHLDLSVQHEGCACIDVGRRDD